MDEERHPWDRRAGEPARAHVYFRRFRDLGPLRSLDVLVDPDARVFIQTLRKWQRTHDWRDRAQAWDDAVARQEDQARLEAIRGMHDRHQRAGRLAQQKALEALLGVPASEIPPYAAARLLELGTRLERDTLTTSVEELQGRTPPAPEDPWEQVARELDSQRVT